jgi:Tfp pilus assembly protein PilN
VINLLPPSLKEQITYAKRNARLIGYLWLIIALATIVGGIFGGSLFLLNNKQAGALATLKERQTVIDSYTKLQADATALNVRLATIKVIQTSQARFSSLLSDLAAYTPKDVFITSINLTGDDKQPVRLSATATSYGSAVALREALAKSPRVSGADIADISNPADGVYKVNVIIAFNPGQSK